MQIRILSLTLKMYFNKFAFCNANLLRQPNRIGILSIKILKDTI